MPTLQTLRLDHIIESPYNPRTVFDHAKLQELAESIQAQGVLQPILVRPLPAARVPDTGPGIQYEIVAGARRYRASLLAKQATIPAIVTALDDNAAMEAALLENLQRQDLTALEEAEGYHALMQHASISADQVAHKIGKSRSYVYGRLKLLDLVAESRQALRDGLLDASRALLVARVPDHKLQLRALAYATKADYTGQLPSTRALQQWLQSNVMLRLEHAPFDQADPQLLPAAGACTTCPKRTGANPDLFADCASADICTDPPCHQAKATAHFDAITAQARAKGQRIVQDREALDMLDGSKHRPLPDGYTSLTRQRPDLSPTGGAPQTLGQLLGADAPGTICFVHPHTQEAMQLVPEDEANAVLLAKGLLQQAQGKAAAKPDPKAMQERLNRLQKLALDEVNDAAETAAHAAMVEAVRTCSDSAAINLISDALLRAWLVTQSQDIYTKEFATAIGFEIAEGTDPDDALSQHLHSLKGYDIERTVALAMLNMDNPRWRYTDDTPLIRQTLAKELGIDVAAIAQATRATVKSSWADDIAQQQAALAEAQKPSAPQHPAAPASGGGGGEAKSKAKPGGKGGKGAKGGKGGKAQPAPAARLSPEDAITGIAAAMQELDDASSAPVGAVATPSPDATPNTTYTAAAPAQPAAGSSADAFAIGQRVRITPDTARLHTRLHKWAGKQGTITRKIGDTAWDVTFRGKHGGLQSFDQSEIEVVEGGAA